MNVHKTFRRLPGRFLNVLCTFNLCLVSTGSVVERNFVNFLSISVKVMGNKHRVKSREHSLMPFKNIINFQKTVKMFRSWCGILLLFNDHQTIKFQFNNLTSKNYNIFSLLIYFRDFFRDYMNVIIHSRQKFLFKNGDLWYFAQMTHF